MSAQVAVVTDSCASIPESLISQLNIRIVAYYIHRGQEVLRDLVTVQRAEFLRWLSTAKQLPTTASPGPGDYLETYRGLIAEGFKQIISIHMSARVSGAYQAARIAQTMLAEQYPEVNIEVVDTQNASLCQGWMVIEATRAALAGNNLAEISAKVRSMIPITRMIQTADTLRYLYMGGRIGLVQNLLGIMLNIKPLVGMKDGALIALGKARSRLQAYTGMADYMLEKIGDGKAQVAYVHAGALEEIDKLKQIVEARVNVAESLIAELSPALAVHTGPGTAGLCFYPIES